ncbi:TfuA-like protein [Streptomyces sp. CBMA156]|uniref:TfuA-like protein n=1 Tax=Streptomyces sp. CBMA156 TaxID=1930280 RepID=UPI001662139C|nr:TfuA-like protein [Streptomyces sp. CBMA156]
MIHLYVGPTLGPSESLLHHPRVRTHPPARHGDLFTDSIADGDRIVLIDGVFHQSPALRHKEILAALGRGIAVFGAASIGALRAAELAPYGMVGVGAVYGAYARGEITGDDEVAVGQAPDGPRQALTVPLVNLRHMLELARGEGVVDQTLAEDLLERFRAVYYPQRTAAAVRAMCRRADAVHFLDWLTGRRAADPHFGDLKRADALAAVHRALDDAPVPAAPAVAENSYFRQWANAHARQRVDGLDLLTLDRVAYQQVFDPRFPTRWHAFLQEHSRRAPGDGRPLDERLAEAGGLPAHRVFRPPVDLRDGRVVARLLAGETLADRLAVARYAAARDAARARPGFSVQAVRAGLVRVLLTQAWRVDEGRLDEEASARGLGSAVRAVDAARALVPGYFDECKEHARAR